MGGALGPCLPSHFIGKVTQPFCSWNIVCIYHPETALGLPTDGAPQNSFPWSVTLLGPPTRDGAALYGIRDFSVVLKFPHRLTLSSSERRLVMLGGSDLIR